MFFIFWEFIIQSKRDLLNRLIIYLNVERVLLMRYVVIFFL